MGGGEKWRWADPQGVQRVIHSDELRSALASGALPPYTLVWKHGMAEWLPAYQAAELANVAISAQHGLIPNIPPPPLAIIAVQAEFEHRVPSFAEATKSESKNEGEPPPPPVHQYAAIVAAVPAHIIRASENAAAQTAAAAARRAARAHAAAAASAPAPPAPAAPAPVVAPPSAPADDELKTLVAKPVTALVAEAAPAGPANPAPSPKPPIVAVHAQPTAPKPPIKAPPRASGGSPTRAQAPPPPTENLRAAPAPPAGADAAPHRQAEPVAGTTPKPSEIAGPADTQMRAPESLKAPPPSMRDDAGPSALPKSSPGAPPPLLPGALRSAPPPPPRRPPPAARGNIMPGVAAPQMPSAPLPLVPPKLVFEMHAPLAPGLHRPSSPPAEHGVGAASVGNGEAVPPSSLHPSSLTPVPPAFLAPFGLPGTVVTGSSPPPHDLPAFPFEEIQPDDVEDDDGKGSIVAEGGLAIEQLGARVVQGIREAQQSLGALAGRARGPIGSMAGRAGDRMVPLPGRAKHWFTSKVGAAIENGFARVKGNPKDPKVVIGLSGAVLLVLGLLFALAGTTGTKSRASEVLEVKPAESAPPVASASEPAPSVSAAPNKPSRVPVACRATREGVRLGDKVSKDVPIEMVVGASGAQARIGFATDAGVAQGISVDLGSLNVTHELTTPVKGKLRAVIPIAAEGKPSFVLNADSPNDKLKSWRTLIVDSLLVIGWANNAISIATKPNEEPTAVWPLDGDEPPDAIRAVGAGDAGQAIVFRRHGEVFGGMLDKDRKPRSGLVDIAGADAPAGAPVGAPAVATSAQSIAVAFADRASSSEAWGIRIGSAPLGSLPTQTSTFTVPSGGPGRAAIAPALAGLSDGRWLLVWTEGGGGDHDVRAQTLDRELRPVGSPFTVSHEGSNAGQAAVAISGGQGLVAHLTLTDQGYELWGAAVDCR